MTPSRATERVEVEARLPGSLDAPKLDGVWTEGRKLLVLLLGKDGVTIRALARESGAAIGTIAKLASGAQEHPSLALAFALERKGIRASAWLERRQ